MNTASFGEIKYYHNSSEIFYGIQSNVTVGVTVEVSLSLIGNGAIINSSSIDNPGRFVSMTSSAILNNVIEPDDIFSDNIYLRGGSLQYSFSVSNCTFYGFGGDTVFSLIGLNGGGNWNHVRFHHNRGLFGGAIYIADTAWLTFNYCTFDFNTAVNTGEAIEQEIFNYNIIYSHTNFSHNTGLRSGGAMGFYDSYYTSFIHCIFEENFCPLYGGSIYFMDNNYFTDIIDTQFLRNHAGTFGGSLRFRSYNDDFFIEYCLFEGNSSPFGGAAYVKHYNHRMVYQHSLFYDNFASDGGNGGTLYLDSYNPEMILHERKIAN